MNSTPSNRPPDIILDRTGLAAGARDDLVMDVANEFGAYVMAVANGVTEDGEYVPLLVDKRGRVIVAPSSEKPG